MTIIVGKHTIDDGNKKYPPGSPIYHMDKEEEERLVSGGYASFPIATELSGESIPMKGESLDKTPVDALPLTLEEFKGLKSAAQQKELLNSLNIEPASNDAGRVDQYAEFLASLDDENGPNTALPE